jgi:hypothetical protein
VIVVPDTVLTEQLESMRLPPAASGNPAPARSS